MYSDFQQFIQDWENKDFQFVIATSGSTSDPKPIELKREKLLYSVNLTKEAIRDIHLHATLCCLPANKMSGFMQLVRAVVWNSELKIVTPSINPMLDIPSNHVFKNISLSPLQLHTIIQDKASWVKLLAFEIILLGGAPCPVQLIDKIKQTNHPGFYLTYGMTETYSHIALRNIPNEYFKVLANTEIRLNQFRELGIKNFITDNGWLNTKDLAEIDDVGKFRILGRRDNLINSGGVKFHAESLEEVVSPFMKSRFFIVGMADEKYGDVITLVTSKNTDIDLEKINEALVNKFGPYAQLKKVVYQPVQFNEITGKVRRELIQ